MEENEEKKSSEKIEYGFRNPNPGPLPQAIEEDIRQGEIMAIKTTHGAEFIGKKQRIQGSKLILEICHKDTDFDFSEIVDFCRVTIREEDC